MREDILQSVDRDPHAYGFANGIVFNNPPPGSMEFVPYEEIPEDYKNAPRTHKVVRPHFFESLGCVL